MHGTICQLLGEGLYSAKHKLNIEKHLDAQLSRSITNILIPSILPRISYTCRQESNAIKIRSLIESTPIVCMIVHKLTALSRLDKIGSTSYIVRALTAMCRYSRTHGTPVMPNQFPKFIVMESGTDFIYNWKN